MADDKIILEAEVKSNIGDVADGIDKAAKNTEKLEKATKKAGGGFKKLKTVVKGVGMALKAAGIGLVVALVAKLMEVFSSNQKVLDAFETGMTALNMAFNDLFNFLNDNIGSFTGFFEDIFENPQQSLKDFGDMIQKNLIERFNSLLETFGYVGSALSALFKGKFKEAAGFAKLAGKELVDVATGVDDSFDKIVETVVKTTDAIVKYTTETYKTAAAITEVNKQAQLAAVQFAKLNAEKLKEAELLRQVRDDETKTFAERIKANEDLGKVLEEQQTLQKAALQIQIDAAQAQVNINGNIENRIALGEAQNAMLELEEAITGQLSEQKTNQVGLEKELLETQNEVRAEGLTGLQRELEELEAAYKEKLKMAKKSGMATTAITKQYEKQKTLLIQENVNAQLEAFAGLAGALSALAGDNKELAIAEAIISTFVGANKAFAQGGVAGYVTAAGVIIAGMANVKKIMEQDVGDGGSSSGGNLDAATQTPAPQMMSGAFTLGGGVAPDHVQAYVVTDDMTNNQNKLAIIRRRATI
jgi:hypothetical protein